MIDGVTQNNQTCKSTKPPSRKEIEGHMFSCGGSIFDYEKRGGGRERERTRDDDEEDRTSTHQGKVSIY